MNLKSLYKNDLEKIIYLLSELDHKSRSSFLTSFKCRVSNSLLFRFPQKQALPQELIRKLILESMGEEVGLGPWWGAKPIGGALRRAVRAHGAREPPRFYADHTPHWRMQNRSIYTQALISLCTQNKRKQRKL